MKKNEQVLEAWLQMTTVINNERITPDLPYNESMICRYLYQNQDINVTATDLCNYMRMQKIADESYAYKYGKKGIDYTYS